MEVFLIMPYQTQYKDLLLICLPFRNTTTRFQLRQARVKSYQVANQTLSVTEATQENSSCKILIRCRSWTKSTIRELVVMRITPLLELRDNQGPQHREVTFLEDSLGEVMPMLIRWDRNWTKLARTKRSLPTICTIIAYRTVTLWQMALINRQSTIANQNTFQINLC